MKNFYNPFCPCKSDSICRDLENTTSKKCCERVIISFQRTKLQTKLLEPLFSTQKGARVQKTITLFCEERVIEHCNKCSHNKKLLNMLAKIVLMLGTLVITLALITLKVVQLWTNEVIQPHLAPK